MKSVQKISLILLVILLITSCVRKFEEPKSYCLISAAVYDMPEFDWTGKPWQNGDVDDSLPDLAISFKRPKYPLKSYLTNTEWDVKSFPIKLTFINPPSIHDTVYSIYLMDVDVNDVNLFDPLFFNGADIDESNHIIITDDHDNLQIILECEYR